MPGELQPLSSNFAVVDERGFPTQYFIKWAQERQIDISGGITAAQAQELIDTAFAARHVIAGTGLDGGGALSADVTLNLEDTAVTPATYGDATHVAQLIIDQQGRITGAVDVPIASGSLGALIDFGVGGATFSFTGAAHSARGNTLTALENFNVTGLAPTLALINGATYVGYLVTMAGSIVAAVLATSSTFIAVGAITQPIFLPFAAPVAVVAGQQFAMIVARTDAIGSSTLTILNPADAYTYTNAPVYCDGFVQLDVAIAPAAVAASTGAGFGAGFGVGLTYTT